MESGEANYLHGTNVVLRIDLAKNNFRVMLS